ncbi:MAG: hypothetical protein M3N33_01530 [Actinomycetota bacterium]|nr:hypothetical protein [Actinomycetota bacterium]
MTINDDHALLAHPLPRSLLEELEGAGMTHSPIAGDRHVGAGVRLRVDSTARRVRGAVVRAGFLPVASAPWSFLAYDFGDDAWFGVRLKVGTPDRVPFIDAHPWRRGLGVALLAPDGAGKSSVTARLAQSLPLDVRVVYLGLFPRADARRRRLPGVGTTQRLLRLWRAWLRARAHQRRGRLVLFDRYPFDALLPGSGGWAERGWRWVLGHALPAPDLTIVLNAPGTVLHARSGEHDAATLELQRQAYLALARRLPETVVIDAAGDFEATTRAVTSAIWDSYRARYAIECRAREEAPLRVGPRSV